MPKSCTSKIKDVAFSIVFVLMLSIIAQVTWTFFLEAFGRLLENGKKTVKSWKEMKFRTREEKAYMSKFKKSCRPLRTGKEGLFVISRITSKSIQPTFLEAVCAMVRIRQNIGGQSLKTGDFLHPEEAHSTSILFPC
ncbi:hypothetical protein Fcan01_24230 [Folsomia candida]|uniref:Uncharacterized protein n=1 Tax=Folsomia candida TaxID=158441 RepID=A0A226D873_FOLCA|nr:hypothetical protein Fcan01_24230 [Folsomia candida]